VAGVGHRRLVGLDAEAERRRVLVVPNSRGEVEAPQRHAKERDALQTEKAVEAQRKHVV
jgi:hypothetical protein